MMQSMWMLTSNHKQINKHHEKYTSSKKQTFLKMKHHVQHSICKAYNVYIETILGLDDLDHHTSTDSTGKFSTKKLFSFLKNCRQDAQGVAPLKKEGGGGVLHTENKVKATILNEQFQCVFTPKSPLSMSQICQQSVDNYISKGKINPSSNQCHDEKYPTMPEIYIAAEGISKLLKNLQPDKAAGPDNIKPIVLKELHQELAPALKVIFQLSLTSGTLPDDWTKARVSPIHKKVTKVSQQTIGQYH